VSAATPRLPHGFPFDPTGGCSPDELLAIAPPSAPEDFDAFWRETFRTWSAIPPRLARTPLPSPFARHALARIDVDAWDGIRVGAWLVAPADGRVVRGRVVGHGYGGRGGPDAREPSAGTAILYPCAPGFDLSARAGLPNVADRHVLHGIGARETYLIRACVASLWASASALVTLFPPVAEALTYEGGSFGGGIGALALPWDARFRRAALIVPTFGHQPWRLRCPGTGSGESVRRHVADHPEAAEVLRSYDAATAAARIRIPTLAAPALFDPAVAPPGQFAIANALCVRRLVVLSAGHFDHPGAAREELALRDEIERWLEPTA
jgi:cephalosporin-C deacetylase